MRIEPFRLLEPDNALTIAESRPNEIFSVAVASAMLRINVGELTRERTDQWLRILDLLSSYTCETIELVIQNANYQIKREREEYRLDILEVDKPRIDSLITIFELLMENSKLRSELGGCAANIRRNPG
jgi:hypothetical protein